MTVQGNGRPSKGDNRRWQPTPKPELIHDRHYTRFALEKPGSADRVMVSFRCPDSARQLARLHADGFVIVRGVD